MPYVCSNCCYVSERFNNFTRHLNLYGHKQDKYHKKELHQCETCGEEFSNQIKLKYHIDNKICVNKEKLYTETEMESLFRDKEKMIRLETENKCLKDIVINNNITKNKPRNVSMKNYIIKNYTNAPALSPITDYSGLTFDGYDRQTKKPIINIKEYEAVFGTYLNDNNTSPEENYAVATIINRHKSGTLHIYLGDYIISHYKKDDPSEQSIWLSDVSRLTYVIRLLLINNEGVWQSDEKGIRTKDLIIKPLLQFIKNYIDIYSKNNVTLLTESTDMFLEIGEILQDAYKVKKDIDNNTLADNILKYIAPFFTISMEKSAADKNDKLLDYKNTMLTS